MQNNNNSLILEYHLFETTQLIKDKKYKKFINQSTKFICHPFMLNDMLSIQLHIQLTRRQQYCYLKILKKYFLNFNQKSQTILLILFNCMNLCQNFLTLINKYKLFQNESEDSVKKITRKQLFQNELTKLSIKQFAIIFDKIEVECKSKLWIRYQEEQLIYLIQQTLMYNYYYCKMSLLKESTIFLKYFINLLPLSQFSSQYIYLIGLTLYNSASIELANETNPQIFNHGFNLLLTLIQEYHKPQSNLILLQSKIIKITSLLIINLDLQSKSEEYISNSLQDSIKSINMADFLGQQILQPLKVKYELNQYIADEYEFIVEKYSQLFLEERDLLRFTQYLFEIKQKQSKTITLNYQKDLNNINYGCTLNDFQKGFQQIESKGQYYAHNRVQQKKNISECFQHNKTKSAHIKQESISISNPYGNNSTLNQTPVVQGSNSPTVNFDKSSFNQQANSFVSQHQISQRKLDNHSSLKSLSDRKRPQSSGIIKQKFHSDHKSYLSQLINLRQKPTLVKSLEQSELQKHHMQLLEQLDKQKKSKNFGSIDQYFNRKIEAITFEECFTLEQIKDTAHKIIQAEWEVHKEMPVTLSLMKSISVSDIQLEAQQDFNKLQESRKMQNIDYLNAQKDKAQENMKHQKEAKKLQINQQQLNLKQNGKQTDRQSLFNTQQLEGLALNQDKKSTQQAMNALKNLNAQLIIKQKQDNVEQKLSPRIQRKNNSLLFNSFVDTESKESGYTIAKNQLIDLMIKNLEQRDDFKTQEQNLKQFVMPRQFRTLNSTPQNNKSQDLLKSQNASGLKSFALSNNSTQITLTNKQKIII